MQINCNFFLKKNLLGPSMVNAFNLRINLERLARFISHLVRWNRVKTGMDKKLLLQNVDMLLNKR